MIIFDECHRSQFGDMHTAITKAFKRYHLFGFTGTPIFAGNAGTGGNPQLRTHRAGVRRAELHTYTIVDAINDKNVLPFRIDYVNTDQGRPRASTTSRSRPSTPSGRCSHPSGSPGRRLHARALRPEDQARARSTTRLGRASGVARLQRAVRHRLDRRRQALLHRVQRSSRRTLTPGPAAQGRADLLLRRQRGRWATTTSTRRTSRPARLDQSSRDFLEAAIQDYNAMFGTSFDTSADKFQNYYKDLSLRLKNREIDLVIVVNMFLTGFDATTLNTLWVDKRPASTTA